MFADNKPCTDETMPESGNGISESAVCRLCARVAPCSSLCDLRGDAARRSAVSASLARLAPDLAIDWNEGELPAALCARCDTQLARTDAFRARVTRAQHFWRSVRDASRASTRVDVRDLPRLLREHVYVKQDPGDLHTSTGDMQVITSIKVEIDTEIPPVIHQSTCEDPPKESVKPVPHTRSTTNTDYKNTMPEGDEKPAATNKHNDSNGKTEKGKKKVQRRRRKRAVATTTDSNSGGDGQLHPVDSSRTWKDYRWRCAECHTEFPTFSELVAHSMERHQRCNLFGCSDCKSKITVLGLFTKHVHTKHREYLKYSCYKCSLLCHSTRHRLQHLATHLHTSHVCRGCTTSFDTEQDLKRHEEKYFRTTRDCFRDKLQDFEGKYRGKTCLICNKTYKSETILLRSHMKSHFKDAASSYVCDVCGKRCSSKGALAYHLSTHSDSKPFQCQLCPGSFRDRARLRLHVLSHRVEKRFACDACGKRFRNSGLLRAHRVTHSEARPFACAACAKRFKTAQYLRHHARQHSGEKRYHCAPCDHRFTVWGNYNLHMRNIHGRDMSVRKRVEADGLGKLAVPVTDPRLRQWMDDTLGPRPRGRRSANTDDAAP